jgi:Ca-activated chloride channel family protein
MDRTRTSLSPLTPRPRAVSVLLAAMTVCALAPVGSSGQSAAVGRAPTFSARVEVIRLSLSVTDGHNRLITGLTEDEFAIFEDGIKQDLAYFTQDPLPLSVALLVDCSASMEPKLPVAQEAASRFIRTLREGDLGQVVQFNERPTVLQDFTGDHDALERAIRSTHAMGPTALYMSLYVSLKQLRSQGTPERPRRRAIVVLTDGEDTASIIDDDQVLELARQADVGVYAIGLRTERAQDRERQAYGQATYFLTTLTRDTGGQVFFTNALSELDAVYERIADELRSQYTVGYVSRNDRRDGRWRRIVVRTPSREDLQVRHKLGYYAAKG